ncbi:ABC transporter ATP-binding protein [Pseudonocardia sp. TRM90224]|uniref:ABC transporter ATP-binding protein n=1 Tax=Pseudonocardia sp. TRM90224 TaxID=2812678 RepID=UPI001E321242|nr:ATP-binding cassette domain-containing protein [Pseudonocardia sp. TRM90224]
MAYEDVGSTAIRAVDVHKRFKNKTALDGFSLTVAAGTVCSVLGPNGAGKTTAVRILSTLLRADAGQASVAGYDVRTDPRRARYRIGLVGQNTSVDEILTGRQNLTLFGKLYHLPTPAARRRAGELLERFDLTEAADQPVAEYSGGMRRRLDLATSLILAPPVLFLDEPTTGLDHRARIDVWTSIRSLVGTGTTVLLTTQYLEEADQLADRIAVIDAGRVVAEGTPDELKAKVGPDRVETVTRKPTLDEVFLHLTGHAAAQKTEQRTEPTP